MLVKFDGETTARHVAATMGNAEIFERLWEWAKEIQNKDELNKNVLLARDKREQTALYVATLWNRIGVVDKLWEFAKEEKNNGWCSEKAIVSHRKMGSNCMAYCGDTSR